MARIILIKVQSGLSRYRQILVNQGHQVVATAGNQFEAVSVLFSDVEADVIVTGNLLYRWPGDPKCKEAHELAKYFGYRKLPIVIASIIPVDRRNWPDDLNVSILGDGWGLEELLTAIDEATKGES